MSHINHENLLVRTEADVEQKVIMPLLTGEQYFAIPQGNIRAKEYLTPTVLDKTAGKTSGYVPDYSVWFSAFPILIIEAKSPNVPSEAGYREASLYARHINQQYRSGINPCHLIISCNGTDLLFGRWDSGPELTLKISELRPGSADFESLRERCGVSALQSEAAHFLALLRIQTAHFPFELAGGQALLNAKLPVNSFAADLSPILRKYFSNQEDIEEIARYGYVNSAAATEYDQVLESLLKERLKLQKSTVIEPLYPGRKGEDKVARAISAFDRERPARGHLQIIQGSVGSGKSLFIHRYRQVLQAPSDAERTRWAFIDFNTAPPDLSNAYDWLCRVFIENFEKENPSLDLYSETTLKGVFSRNIRDVRYTSLWVESRPQRRLLQERRT